MQHCIRKFLSYFCFITLITILTLPTALAENSTNQQIKVTNLSLDKSYALLLFSDSHSETITLQPKIEPENATDKNIKWESSNENVATVKDGVVKGVGSGGTAVITATTKDGGFTATCFVSVVENEAPNVEFEKELAAALSQEGSNVSMEYSSQKLDSYTLERFKAVGKIITLNVNDELGRKYSWTFDGNSLTDIRPSYSYYISVEPADPDTLNMSRSTFPAGSKLDGFNIRESLPGSPVLTLNVSSVYADNTELYLYSVNSVNAGNSSGLAADKLVVTNGKVSMPICKASEYILCDQAMSAVTTSSMITTSSTVETMTTQTQTVTTSSTAETTANQTQTTKESESQARTDSPGLGDSPIFAGFAILLIAAAVCIITVNKKKAE